MSKLAIFLLMGSLFVQGCQQEPLPLTGSWRFVADQELDSLGNVVKQDTNVNGLLLYTENGMMSVQFIWLNKRKPFLNDNIMEGDGISSGLGIGSNQWTADQNRTWVDSYDAYFGRYKVDQVTKTVIHTIDYNLRPEKTQKEYQRKYLLSNDTLRLQSSRAADKWRVVLVRIN